MIEKIYEMVKGMVKDTAEETLKWLESWFV
jgi:hypothetical protein